MNTVTLNLKGFFSGLAGPLGFVSFCESSLKWFEGSLGFAALFSFISSLFMPPEDAGESEPRNSIRRVINWERLFSGIAGSTPLRICLGLFDEAME